MDRVRLGTEESADGISFLFSFNHDDLTNSSDLIEPLNPFDLYHSNCRV